MKTDWNPVLQAELAKPYWAELQTFVAGERAAGPVYPAADAVFAALHLTPFADTRVVILGQDPYHGPGQAHGLCFSVQRGVKVPPSLVNMYKELAADVGCSIPKHGNLEPWARQGILLLNTTMTVRGGEANSHQGKGWETFTDAVIAAVAAKSTPVIFVLWGASARKKRALILEAARAAAVAASIDPAPHLLIESAHPSPLSAHNGFLGSRPFSRVNEALVSFGQTPIDWQLPN
jgi:uracil-DNA glycosylase